VNVRLYVLQRGSAALMMPLVLVHLAVIFYASSHDLSAADIFARTRGSAFWGTFYALFVAAAAIPTAIGVRVIVAEWGGLRGAAPDLVMWSFGLLLAALGLTAVAAVVLA
jgi:fumarate reductase subunit C